MREKITLLLALCLMSIASAQAQYRPDTLGDGFEQRTLEMGDDYEGRVVATLVRSMCVKPSKNSILYIHGYNDYFFQDSMARRFNDSLYNFYAVDLRKYGRSMLDHQRPFNTRAMDEYFPEITRAIEIMHSEGTEQIIMMGHSTGGLITSLYCDSHRGAVQGLILNSPFLDMNLSWSLENILLPLVSAYGRISKETVVMGGSEGSAYAESLLSTAHGEWNYDTNLKMSRSLPYTSGWLRAIHRGHKRAQKGLKIDCPILLMYSDKSVYGTEWSEEFQSGDSVLDVEDIAKYGKDLGDRVQQCEIADGLHDLALSKYKAREVFYSEIFKWLKNIK